MLFFLQKDLMSNYKYINIVLVFPIIKYLYKTLITIRR
jgi:hypothetical protein